ncbi:MAG: UDP-3-O-acyl-N-acetylglucosamine deacetylase [Thermoguttaceae bacterium]|jgi:UDP-3-O-acyl N-acetylglucosamine deacetylase
METTRNQQTLAAAAAIEGVGYWSGRDVRVEFRPAEADTGIVFVRRDLPHCPRVAARVEHCVESPRRTTLRSGEAVVEMIEHLMAALAGLEIDNCEVWVDQAEIPGLDGSALPFVTVLQNAGVVVQNTPRSVRTVTRPLRIGTEESWIEVRPAPPGKTILQYELDYGNGNPIGRQSLEILLSAKHFPVNLAPSRTFVLEHEAAALRARGLGQRTTFQDLLIFGPDGPIGNALRFPDECVRHKIVDMIGDLALAGCDLAGRFVAYRSGHRLNAELVRALLSAEAEPKTWKRCA